MSLIHKTIEFLLHSWSDKEVILDKCIRHLELIGPFKDFVLFFKPISFYDCLYFLSSLLS